MCFFSRLRHNRKQHTNNNSTSQTHHGTHLDRPLQQSAQTEQVAVVMMLARR